MNDWWQLEWQKAREQLAANPRLRLGLATIPLIALFYLNLLATDERREQHTAIASLHNELRDAQQLATQSEWTSRLEQARDALDKQQLAYFANADSEALARADIQAYAKAQIEKQNLQQIRIEVSTAGKSDPHTQLIALQLQLAGTAQGTQLYALISALESGTPRHRIDSLNVQSQSGQSLVFSLIASVWYAPWGAK
jgi:hypothetical protein